MCVRGDIYGQDKAIVNVFKSTWDPLISQVRDDCKYYKYNSILQ